MTARPWYRRFPDNFIGGTVGLTLEEKGAYSLVLDLIYVRGGPIPDEPRYIAGVCNCSVRKWQAIRAKLIELGKIVVVEGGLMNPRAEHEIEKADEVAEKMAENGAKGGIKSGEKRRASHKTNGLAEAKSNLYNIKIQSKSTQAFLVPTDGVVLDRWRHDQEALFAACERLMDKKVPDYQQRATFPAEIVAKARLALEPKAGAA